MATTNLYRRLLDLESQGKAAEAVDVLLAELEATRTVPAADGPTIVPDHERRMEALRAVMKFVPPAKMP